MFALSPALDLTWVARRPRNASRLEAEGWTFLPLHREWDAAEKELAMAATGLAAISRDHAEHAPQAWWIAFLRAYLTHLDPVHAASEAQHANT